MKYGIPIALTLLLFAACEKPASPDSSEVSYQEAKSLVEEKRQALADNIQRRDKASGPARQQLDLMVQMSELTLKVAEKYLAVVESGQEKRSFAQFKLEDEEFKSEMTKLTDSLYQFSGDFARQQAEFGEALESAP